MASKKKRKSFSRYFVPVVLVVIVLFGGLLYWTNDPLPSVVPQKITIKGELVCLPHKEQRGPQTLECAFGLKDDNGTYYGLSDTDAEYKNISQPIGKQYEAVGQVTPVENSVYTIQSTIKLQSLTPIN